MSLNLDDLNPEQRLAVETTEGPLLILAGAGSGKTRVLTRRIAHLVERGVEPWRILAVTFTNKAAQEMSARVGASVGPAARRILVTTFHSAAMRFLRRDIERLGAYNRQFTIYDDDDQGRLIKQICETRNVNTDKYPVNRIRYAIDRAKNRLMGPEDLRDPARRGGVVDLNDPTPEIYTAYQRALRDANAVDFNDLLNLLVELWSDHPDLLASYQDRFRYLMVDEYQDTNQAQYQLVKLLGGYHRNVAVVGDDDQSIYAFRGADIRNILDFERDFPDAAVIRLERNYRSTGNILAVASAVVQNNAARMPKTMRTEAGPGAPVKMMAEQDEAEEAAAVLTQVRGLLKEGFQPGEIALIYRTNAASRAFEAAFAQARIPYALVGARKFFERKEVRDILAYIKLVLNPADDMAFARAINVPSRGIGPKAMEGIRAEAEALGRPMLAGLARWANGGGKSRAGGQAFSALILRLQQMALAVEPAELVRAIIEESGYAGSLRAEATDEAQGRLENLEELVRAVEAAAEELALLPEDEDPEAPPPPTDGLSRLQAFVDRAALASGADDLPDAGGQVTMLTSHLAKGLEYRAVFVTGLYEGGFPHFRSLQRNEDIEEERRLVYVAFTRARERLFLTRPRMRMVFEGSGPPRRQNVAPSRFLSEVPIDLLASRPSPFPTPARALPTPTPPRPVVPPSRPTLVRPLPAAPPRPPGERTMAPDSPDALQNGVTVLHPQFGRGVIRGREGPPANLKLTIHFDPPHGRKVLFARHAHLEILLS